MACNRTNVISAALSEAWPPTKEGDQPPARPESPYLAAQIACRVNALQRCSFGGSIQYSNRNSTDLNRLYVADKSNVHGFPGWPSQTARREAA